MKAYFLFIIFLENILLQNIAFAKSNTQSLNECVTKRSIL